MPLRSKIPRIILAAASIAAASAFTPSSPSSHCRLSVAAKNAASAKSKRYSRPLLSLSATNEDNANNESENEEAKRLQQKAQDLRDQIRQMESKIGDGRRARYNSQKDDYNIDNNNNDDESAEPEEPADKSLANKRVLILGANGRLGSMVTRHLLRTHGKELKEVVAAVHFVGQATTRGYGRLSYEVGAEDGVGTIGAAWAPEDERNASFEYDPVTMSGYNLNKLRLVEVELLDPVQVRTITEDVDAIIYCATDFEGNRPRAVASLNAAFLFRAVAAPTKGRVEIEGLQNVLEGLVGNMNDQRYKNQLAGDSTTTKKKSDPTQFILVSTCPDAFGEFETPFGEFNGVKRQGERLVMEEFPSVSYSVLQMGKYDDNFVQEGQELQYAMAEKDTVVKDGVIGAAKPVSDDGMQKRINRRDAARAAVEALLDEDIEGKKVMCYTAERKTDIW